MSYSSTQEQLDILEAIKRGEMLIKINAFAGTGKTTTLIEISKLFNTYKKILYIAFNRAIKEEAIAKFGSNVIVKTTHSLAYAGLWSFMKGAKIKNGYRPSEIAEMFNIDYADASTVLAIFKNYCNSAFKTISLNEETISNTNINTYKRMAIELFEMMVAKKIEITHDFYLKFYQLQLLEGRIKSNYDLVLLDEAQDTNDVTLSIFYLLNSKQRVIVGDRHQQIYSFRGGVNAMQKVKASVYHLTKSFRFEQGIADKANTFLSLFKDEKKKLTGTPPIIGDHEVESEVFLSRSNSKLIELADSFLKSDIYFKTIREPYDVFGLAINILKLSRREKLDNPYKFLNSYSFSFIEQDGYDDIFEYLEDISRESGDVELSMATKIASKYKEKLFSIYKKVKEFYEDEEEASVFLSTAHTAKGLEWDGVTVCSDFRILAKIAEHFINKLETGIENFLQEFRKDIKDGLVKQDIIDELNLYYVAITRAKKILVDDTEINSLEEEKINLQIKYIIKEYEENEK